MAAISLSIKRLIVGLASKAPATDACQGTSSSNEGANVCEEKERFSRRH